jgi:hypothetical protein
MAVAITVVASITLDRIDHSKKLEDAEVMELLEGEWDGSHLYDDDGYEYVVTVQRVEVTEQ